MRGQRLAGRLMSWARRTTRRTSCPLSNQQCRCSSKFNVRISSLRLRNRNRRLRRLSKSRCKSSCRRRRRIRCSSSLQTAQLQRWHRKTASPWAAQQRLPVAARGTWQQQWQGRQQQQQVRRRAERVSGPQPVRRRLRGARGPTGHHQSGRLGLRAAPGASRRSPLSTVRHPAAAASRRVPVAAAAVAAAAVSRRSWWSSREGARSTCPRACRCLGSRSR